MLFLKSYTSISKGLFVIKVFSFHKEIYEWANKTYVVRALTEQKWGNLLFVLH